MPEPRLQSNMLAASAGTQFTDPLWVPSRHETQFGQIVLRPALVHIYLFKYILEYIMSSSMAFATIQVKSLPYQIQ